MYFDILVSCVLKIKKGYGGVVCVTSVSNYKQETGKPELYSLSFLVLKTKYKLRVYAAIRPFRVICICYPQSIWTFKNVALCSTDVLVCQPFVLLKSMFPADLLPLVLIALIIGYTDQEHSFCSAETKFATAIASIIPLSYYIGMGIAR